MGHSEAIPFLVSGRIRNSGKNGRVINSKNIHSRNDTDALLKSFMKVFVC